jgi:hypothetical protein
LLYPNALLLSLIIVHPLQAIATFELFLQLQTRFFRLQNVTDHMSAESERRCHQLLSNLLLLSALLCEVLFGFDLPDM